MRFEFSSSFQKIMSLTGSKKINNLDNECQLQPKIFNCQRNRTSPKTEYGSWVSIFLLLDDSDRQNLRYLKTKLFYLASVSDSSTAEILLFNYL